MHFINLENETEAVKKFQEISNESSGIESIMVFTDCEEALEYVLKSYSREELERQIQNIQQNSSMRKETNVYFQTIPHFELFINGKLVPITQKKVKELLAVLVDYAGSSVTSEQAINYLWEDRLVDNNTKALLRVTARRLRNFLRQENIEDILIENNGVRALNRDKVDCDYYRILDGDKTVLRKYHGEYMVEYSWAENTNAQLNQMKEISAD